MFMLSLKDLLFACNDNAFRTKLNAFIYLARLDELQRSIAGVNREVAFVLACMIRGFLAGEIVQAT